MTMDKRMSYHRYKDLFCCMFHKHFGSSELFNRSWKTVSLRFEDYEVMDYKVDDRNDHYRNTYTGESLKCNYVLLHRTYVLFIIF